MTSSAADFDFAGRRLSELRASDLGDHLGPDSVLVLPVGAIEQHGPHLPFNTDLVIATACAAGVARSVGAELDLDEPHGRGNA